MCGNTYKEKGIGERKQKKGVSAAFHTKLPIHWDF